MKPAHLSWRTGARGSLDSHKFWPHSNEIYSDEDQPGLEIGRDKETGEIIGYMTLDLLNLCDRIMTGLRAKPIAGRFAIVSVSDEEGTRHYSNLTDLTFPEVVEWVYETYFAKVAEERGPAQEPSLALRERGGEYKEDKKEG